MTEAAPYFPASASVSLPLLSHCSNHEPALPHPAVLLPGEKVTWPVEEAISSLTSCSPCSQVLASQGAVHRLGFLLTQPDPGAGGAGREKDEEGLGLWTLFSELSRSSPISAVLWSAQPEGWRSQGQG